MKYVVILIFTHEMSFCRVFDMLVLNTVPNVTVVMEVMTSTGCLMAAPIDVQAILVKHVEAPGLFKSITLVNITMFLLNMKC